MTPEKTDKERQFLIKLVQDRYKWLSVTASQAEAIYHYEDRIEKVHAGDYIPTFWEEKEIEHYFFKQVLSDDQFAFYVKTTAKHIRDAEKQMIRDDADVVKQVAYHKKLLSYYKEDLVPKFIQHQKENHVGSLPETRRRIGFLKAEYDQYLNVRFKEVCVSHFRYARNFQPNQFQVEILRHEIEKVLPSYYFFKKASDTVIREVGKFLIDKMVYEQNLFLRFMDGLADSIKTETKKLGEEFFDETSGFAIEVGAGQMPEEQKQDEFLSYLLIDPKRSPSLYLPAL